MCNLHIYAMSLQMSIKMCKLHTMLDLLERLLAPVARLLIARGVPFPDFAEQMKRHYVAAAEGLAGEDGQKVTDSRLSVMTGLQRRDIGRLKGTPAPTPRPNHLARLVALWQTSPDTSSEGVAFPLHRSGPAPSFESLARDVRRDVHPRSMLDTLVDTGTVSVAHGHIVLLQPSYQPLAGSEDQIAYLSDNTGDHLSAATENVLGHEPPHFERAVHYTGLTAEQVAELEQDYREAQMDILKSLSQKAAAMKRTSKGPHRFRAGGYFYTAKGNRE